MKTKTVRLNNSYTIVGGDVCQFTLIEPADYEISGDINDEKWGYVPTQYRVGTQCMLVSHVDVSPNALWRGDSRASFSLVFDAPDGIGGNSNQNIRRFHGWLGTTNDVSCRAHGWREITRVRILRWGQVAITVGPDLLPECE